MLICDTVKLNALVNGASMIMMMTSYWARYESISQRKIYGNINIYFLETHLPKIYFNISFLFSKIQQKTIHHGYLAITTHTKSFTRYQAAIIICTWCNFVS